MSRFYASINGTAKTQATRQGSQNSGIFGHIRGWNAGVKVYGHYNKSKNRDEFQIYLTYGSNSRGSDIYIGKVIDAKDGPEYERTESAFFGG